MTRSSTLQTQTAVFEDESIMLAGYLRDIEESGGWGIPYLRDIPWIGWIFGGASVKKETVQRMFIISPHIVDLDAEMLARLQSTRLRNIEEAEQMEDDADASDGERRRRDLERDDARRRREERDDDLYERRKAEIRHIQELRKLDRRRKQRYLSEEIKAWREIERAERERLEAEAQAAAAAEFAEEESKKEGKTEE